MEGWKFEILDANGKKETIVDFAYIQFTNTINDIGTFTIAIPTAGNYAKNKYLPYMKSNDNGKEQGIVYFTNPDGFLEFKGIVREITYDSQGNMILRGFSTLAWAKDVALKGVDRGSETNVSRAQYILGVVDNYYKLTYGTITSYGTLKAIYYEHSNCFEAIDQMTILECDQDYFVKYNSTIGGNDTFETRNHVGSSTSIKTFLDGVDVRNVQMQYNTTEIINSVKVLGTVKNGTQISATASDSTSISRYGLREPNQPIINLALEDNASAQKYADNIIANYKDPKLYISFQVMNLMLAEDPDDSPRTKGKFALGDEISLTSTGVGLSEEPLRIVSYTRKFFKNKTQTLHFKCISSDLRYRRGNSLLSANRSGAPIGGSTSTAAHNHGKGDLGTYHPHNIVSHSTASAGGSSSYICGGRMTELGSATLTSSFKPIATISFDSDSHTSFLITDGSIVEDSSTPSQTKLYVRVYDGSDTFPDLLGAICYSDGKHSNFLIVYPKDVAGKNIQVEVAAESNINVKFLIRFQGPGLHSHTISSISNGADYKLASMTTGSTDDTSASVGSSGLYAKGSAD